MCGRLCSYSWPRDAANYSLLRLPHLLRIGGLPQSSQLDSLAYSDGSRSDSSSDVARSLFAYSDGSLSGSSSIVTVVCTSNHIGAGGCAGGRRLDCTWWSLYKVHTAGMGLVGPAVGQRLCLTVDNHRRANIMVGDCQHRPPVTVFALNIRSRWFLLGSVGEDYDGTQQGQRRA